MLQSSLSSHMKEMILYMELNEKLEMIIQVFDSNKIPYSRGICNSLNINYINNSVSIINENIIEYLFNLSHKCVSGGLTKKDVENIQELTAIDSKLAKVKKEKDIQKFETKVEEIIMNNPVEIKKEGMVLESYKWIESIYNCDKILHSRTVKENEKTFYQAVMDRCENSFKLLEGVKDPYSKKALSYEEVVCKELSKYSDIIADKNIAFHSLNESFDKVDAALNDWSKLNVVVSKKDKQKEYWMFKTDNRAQLIVDTENYREDLTVLKNKLESYKESTEEIKGQYEEKLESIKVDQARIDELRKQMEENRKLLVSGKMTKDEALRSGKNISAEINRLEAHKAQINQIVQDLQLKAQLRELKYDKLELCFSDLFLEKNNDVMLAAYMRFISLKTIFAFIDGVSNKEETDKFFINLAALQSQASQQYTKLKEQLGGIDDIRNRNKREEFELNQTQVNQGNIDDELEKLYGPLSTTEEPVEQQVQEETVTEELEDVTQILK